MHGKRQCYQFLSWKTNNNTSPIAPANNTKNPLHKENQWDEVSVNVTAGVDWFASNKI